MNWEMGKKAYRKNEQEINPWIWYLWHVPSCVRRITNSLVFPSFCSFWRWKRKNNNNNSSVGLCSHQSICNGEWIWLFVGFLRTDCCVVCTQCLRIFACTEMMMVMRHIQVKWKRLKAKMSVGVMCVWCEYVWQNPVFFANHIRFKSEKWKYRRT